MGGIQAQLTAILTKENATDIILHLPLVINRTEEERKESQGVTVMNHLTIEGRDPHMLLLPRTREEHPPTMTDK